MLLGLLHDPGKDHGTIRIHMPGASGEQIAAVEGWLTAEFGPVKMLPSAETPALPNDSETGNA